MKAFAPYVQTLEQLLLGYTTRTGSVVDDLAVSAALDGQPAKRLRELIPIELRRSAGAFFTPAHLAKRAVAPMCASVKPESVVLDPACGAGDLLIALATTFPIRPTLSTTLRQWSGKLSGRDLYPEFIQAAKLRLLLLALKQGTRIDGNMGIELTNAFQSLKVGSGVADPETVRAATHILLNPPYSKIKASHDCQWAAGSINYAAEFVHFCLANANHRTRISAILPDVLRSGTRYRRWRNYVLSKLTIETVECAGLFDAFADVDVFILTGTLRKRPSLIVPQNWLGTRPSKRPKITKMFELAVGSVVPFRDPQRGPILRYVTPKALPPWKTIREVPARRKFDGRTFQPPFVAIRRTSRPGDEFRAVPTVVLGDNPIAVENHLLIATPLDGTIKTCRKLVKSLRDSRTTKWLDRRLRCRHLTTAAIAELPMFEE